jgi:hypothetical protein
MAWLGLLRCAPSRRARRTRCAGCGLPAAAACVPRLRLHVNKQSLRKAHRHLFYWLECRRSLCQSAVTRTYPTRRNRAAAYTSSARSRERRRAAHRSVASVCAYLSAAAHAAARARVPQLRQQACVSLHHAPLASLSAASAALRRRRTAPGLPCAQGSPALGAPCSSRRRSATRRSA